MWLIQAIIVHVIFLGSIFVIYFRSPILTTLTPQNDLENPPARRLVLIVTDGLRASSFYKDKSKLVPNIKSIFLEQGCIGISHTRVPTESRPGHIALIAGLYEDPSAVTKGWKENPIDFDSVFNRSYITRAWGASDILSIFAKCTDKEKIEIFMYDHDLDFSGKDKTYKLDEWVFDRFEKFLESSDKIKLKSERKVIYFLHLLGLDSSGHIHLPNTKLFNENLNYTEGRIYDLYQKFEEIFDDKLTAYILTSDHGMSDTGAHGAGSQAETDTPLFVWGAGVKTCTKDNLISKNYIKFGRYEIPLLEVEQAAVAPLMSSLIGVAAPMNNYGKLPVEILNVSDEYAAEAVFNNAKQILLQYETLHSEFDTGLLSNYLPRFNKLEIATINIFTEINLHKIRIKDFNYVISNSKTMISTALEGIEFYQKYYQNLLLFCVTIAILGWIVYLFLNICNILSRRTSNLVLIVGFLILKIPLLLIHLQGIPSSIGLYILLPVIIWTVTLSKFPFGGKKLNVTCRDLWELFKILVGSQVLVYSFVRKEIVSIVFFIFSMNKLHVIYNDKDKGPSQILKFIILTSVIASFPFLKSVHGNRNDYFMLLSVVLWVYKILTVNFLKLSKTSKMYFILELLNVYICIYKHNHLIGIPMVILVFSWVFLIGNFTFPLLQSQDSKIRLESILISLFNSYFMLSISYEPIFLILLITHLKFLMEANIIANLNSKHSAQNIVNENIHTQIASLQIAFVLLMYTIISFFGTGNIASVSSFDINIVRCFITTFSPFIIMFLVILKLAIPIILILAVITALTSAHQQQKKIFMSVLIICNFMGITTLYLVTNKGSWLEIGESISRFVIMQVTTLVLFLISGVVLLLFQFTLFDAEIIKFHLPTEARKIV
ncbi:GPI ethanolamine phosphate transferase 1 [Condylostylus longicornis]|uniref:GPI ethanolamine phosphate transferase 1 n=1 Tax=Condylostylus longicornis TaxID=2530218 RepID=UPI00244DE16A|nr:GPI ethanolamine phosphate transferase 1 [Condylostylus longicornis]